MHAGREPGPVSGLDEELIDLAVEVFSMLADPTRVRLVMALQPGELSVNTLADLVEKSPAAVSQHLAKMRLSRLVTTRREGNRIYYRLANEHVAQLVSDALFQAEHAVSDQPRHHNRSAARSASSSEDAEIHKHTRTTHD